VDNGSPQVAPSQFRYIRCGYDLSGTPVGGVCPECGEAVEKSLTLGRGDAPVPMAMPCMVVGIVSLVACALAGPVAILLYFRAQKQFDTGIYSASSMTMARAGLVMGIISTILLGLVGIIALVG
jgi:hypothetical protein